MTKNTLVNKIVKYEVDSLNFNGETPKHLDLDDIHDISLFIEIKGVKIEDDDVLYNWLLSILDEDIISDINNKLLEMYEYGTIL